MSNLYWTHVVLLIVVTLCPVAATADVRFVPGTPEAVSDDVFNYPHVLVSGTISAIDAERFQRLFQRAIDAAPFRWSSGLRKPIVFLNSTGGDVHAAMRMGRMLRKGMGIAWVRGECSSACALILAAGADRAVFTSGRIGIHRPFFDKSAFAKLSPGKAQSLYQINTSLVEKYLLEMGVSPALYERMLKIPSHQGYYLSDEEIESFGFQSMPPAIAEWERANALERNGAAFTEVLERWIACTNSGEPAEECTRRYGVKAGPSR